MDPTSGLRVSNLSVQLTGRNILTQISMHLPHPGIASVVGRNASGKTTLLKALAGLLPACQAFHFSVDGMLLCGQQEISRFVRYVPSEITIEFPTRVEEFLELGQWNVSNPDERQIHDLAKRFDLLSLMDREWMALSSGERQRCALVRALISSPRVLLLDESLSHLDPDVRVKVMHQLKDWSREQKAWIIWVSHDLSFVREVSDWFLFIHAGSVMSQGAATDSFFKESCAKLYPSLYRD